MDEFLLRPLAAGLGLALLTGPLGCLVAWRRMAYFGDALAHAALLGVVVGLLVGITPLGGVAGVAVASALILSRSRQASILSADSLLGILSHGALALGLLVLSVMDKVRVDLMGWLMGDILSTGWDEVTAIWACAMLGGWILARHWNTLVAASVDENLARVEGHDVERARLVLMILVALAVTGAMKLAGVMLVTALLIVPAAAARPFARTPEAMALGAVLAGWIAVTAGLSLAWQADTPAGPAVVAVAVFLFILVRLGHGLKG